MYGALWRVLPGPWWVRALIMAALAAAAVFALVTWAFPAMAEHLTFFGGGDATVGGS